MAEGLKHNAPDHRRLVTVFGGTGFLGRRIVRHLLEHGFGVRAASRHSERAQLLFRSDDNVPEAVKADVHDDAAVAGALAGAYGIVNAVSLYVEHGHETFHAVHVEAAARIARLAREAGVERLVHVSGIGADPNSPSRYIGARGQGETAVQQAFPDATFIRPAVMFGPDDAFLTRLVRLIRILPVYPLFGTGKTRLQPVYVEDVAEAISRVLEDRGQARAFCYEFGGPHIYTYEELIRKIAGQINARTRLVPMPFLLWRALAWVSEFLPGAPLTRNQIALMQRDNVASGSLPGLSSLGIAPTTIEDVVPAIEGKALSLSQ